MNFYDEAIEAKHTLQNDLVSRQREIRGLKKLKVIEELETTRGVVLDHLYDRDIAALEDADPYFWEPRLTQLVLATGQQLPETVAYDASWLHGKGGYWWFGRSSPLVGVSHDNQRRYVNALLWNLNPNGSLSIQTFYVEGRTQYSLGALNWEEGETLTDVIKRLEESKVTVTHTPDLVIRDLALRLAQECTAKTHEMVELTKEAQAAHEKVGQIGNQIVELGGELDPAHPYDSTKYDVELVKRQKEEQVERQRVERFGADYQERLAEWAAASRNALVTFACGCLWLKQKITTVAQAPLTRAAERRLDKIAVSKKCLVVELRSKQYVRTSESDETKHVDWAWQWAVRGHWRDQPTKEGNKLIWIHPFIKGPDDKPLKPTAARVFAVTR